MHQPVGALTAGSLKVSRPQAPAQCGFSKSGIFDHEAIVATPDGQSVDAHTNNRYHAYWTLAAYNAYYNTTRIVILHIPSTAS